MNSLSGLKIQMFEFLHKAKLVIDEVDPLTSEGERATLLGPPCYYYCACLKGTLRGDVGVHRKLNQQMLILNILWKPIACLEERLVALLSKLRFREI